MSFIDLRSEGEQELIRKLDRLDDSVTRKIVRAGVNRAATPILKEARKRAPIGPPTRKHIATGGLAKNLTKRVVKYESGAIVATIGGKWREGAHAHFVELGTQARMRKGGWSTGTMPAQPFMKAAFNAKYRESVRMMREIILGKIEREAQRGA